MNLIQKPKKQLKQNHETHDNIPYWWDAKILFQYAKDGLLGPENMTLNAS